MSVCCCVQSEGKHWSYGLYNPVTVWFHLSYCKPNMARASALLGAVSTLDVHTSRGLNKDATQYNSVLEETTVTPTAASHHTLCEGI